MAGNVDGHKVRAVNTMGRKATFSVVVPTDDETTLRWIAAQNSLSVSLRLVAKYLTAKVGAVDFLSAFDFDALAQEGASLALAPESEAADGDSAAPSSEPACVLEVADDGPVEPETVSAPVAEPIPEPVAAPSPAPSADDAASRLQRMMGGL